MDLEPWLSVEGIAAYLGVSKESIYRWLDKNKIPSHRIGKFWKFKASEVDKWIYEGSAANDLSLERNATKKNDIKDQSSGRV